VVIVRTSAGFAPRGDAEKAGDAERQRREGSAEKLRGSFHDCHEEGGIFSLEPAIMVVI
jgi:hypothetical protein